MAAEERSHDAKFGSARCSGPGQSVGLAVSPMSGYHSGQQRMKRGFGKRGRCRCSDPEEALGQLARD
jgi:hypothetical protein